MPQTQTEKRETAKRLYVESGGKILLKEIAAKLEARPSTVSSWKKADKWDSCLKRKPRHRKHPTMKGNQNAAKPHPSQAGNKNALKHGRYEEIKYATMTDEEKGLMDEVRKNADQIQMQINLIAELELRESRMYTRIEALRKSAEADKEGLVTDFAMLQTNTVETKEGKKSGPMRVGKQRKHGTDKIQEIEVALTAVQRQKQRAIICLHRLTEDQVNREIEKERLKLEKKRVNLLERRLALVDPSSESDTLKEAREILKGIPSAF